MGFVIEGGGAGIEDLMSSQGRRRRAPHYVYTSDPARRRF